MFSCKSFIVAVFIFNIYFKFIFVYGIKEGSSFIFLDVAVQFSQHHLLKRLSFLHYYKNNNTKKIKKNIWLGALVFLVRRKSTLISSVHACLVVPSCLTLCNPIDCSPLSFSVHGSLCKNTGGDYQSLLQRIFQTQELNPSFLSLLHCRWIIYLLSHWGSPVSSRLSISFRLITKVSIYNSVCSNLLQHCISYWILSHFSMNIGVYRFSCIVRKVLKKR